MTQRQREEGVVAFHIQVQFQLFAPRAAVAHQRAAAGPKALLPVVQSIMQLAQRIQARTQHRLVRSVARVGAVQQRHMPRLTHQSRQSHHAQIASFALGVAAARQFSWCGGRDVRVKVGSVERQYVSRQLKPPHRRAGDPDLGPFQLRIADLRRPAVKFLPRKCPGRQARMAFFSARSTMLLSRGTPGFSRNAARWHLAEGAQAR